MKSRSRRTKKSKKKSQKLKKTLCKKTQKKRGKARGVYTYLYILESRKNPRKTYVGVTNEPFRRLRQHNGEISGGARYTKIFAPWNFHSIFRFNNRTDALSVEWKAKHCRSKSDGKGVSGVVARVTRHGAAKPGFSRVVRGV